MDLTFINNQTNRDEKTKISPLPFRFFGPVSHVDADYIVEDVLDDHPIRDTLMRFAKGEIEPRELSLEIQILMEAAEQRRNNAGRDEHENGDFTA